MEISPGLLLFILVALSLIARGIINNRNDERRLAFAWHALSLRTGLAYLEKQISLEGEFRGHPISMNRVIVSTGGPRAEDGGGIEKYTQVTITLRRISAARLQLRAKTLSDSFWPFGKEFISIVNHDLRWDVNIIGKPPDFIRNVVALLSHADPKAFKCLGLSTITLDGSTLVSMQHGFLTNIDLAVSLLELYSDIADLAEASNHAA